MPVFMIEDDRVYGKPADTKPGAKQMTLFVQQMVNLNSHGEWGGCDTSRQKTALRPIHCNDPQQDVVSQRRSPILDR